jgi:hypothetical protein
MLTAVESKPTAIPSLASANGQATPSGPGEREIRYEHSRNFPGVLER